MTTINCNNIHRRAGRGAAQMDCVFAASCSERESAPVGPHTSRRHEFGAARQRLPAEIRITYLAGRPQPSAKDGARLSLSRFWTAGAN